MIMPKCVSATENSIKVADKYIKAVIDKKIPSCQLVYKAVKRHLDDLEHQNKYYFDRQEADFRLKVFNYLHHSKGKWAGQKFILSPWQQFLVAVIFGWKKKADGKRRFKQVYLEVPRKNGKTTCAAGIALNLLDIDGEMGAEVYAAATKKDQARIVHEEATRMVASSPALKSHITIMRNNLNVADTCSKFEPLSSDYNSLDGLNIHGAIIDELHAHKTRELYDVIDTATGAREQPMIFMITTAGVQMESICREMHEYTENILNNVVKDDTFFGLIYTIDEKDKWDDETAWYKANPNLGISLSIESMREEKTKAMQSKSSLAAWQRYHLNIWGGAVESWISYDKWEACKTNFDFAEMQGRKCYIGMDLSSTTDTTAICCAFPMDDGTIKVFWRFWLPEVGIEAREHIDRVPYRQWASEGYLTLTQGDVIDYDYIENEIMRWAAQFEIQEIIADPYNATQLLNHLGDNGLPVFEHRQGFISMNAPTKAFEVAVLSGNLQHEDNPMMRWQIGNAELKVGDGEVVKPVKKNGRKRMRIDGVIAAVMAVGRINITQEEEEKDYTVLYL